MSVYVAGQPVRLEYNGQTVKATVLLASENGVSLMLVFDGILRTHAEGAFIARIPLLLDDDGIYRDLFDQGAATLTPWRDDA